MSEPTARRARLRTARTNRPGALAIGAVVIVALTATTGAWANDVFDDVPDSNVFHDDITWMADNEIAEGFADGGFHPTAPVSRQAMSAFMHRQADHVVAVAVGSRRTWSGAAFHDMDTTTDINFDSQGYLQNAATTGTDCWVMSPDLPDGSHLDKISISAVDNGTTSVDLTLQAKGLSNTDSPIVVGEIFTAGASSAVQNLTVNIDHTVDIDAFAYFATVCIAGQPGNNYRFYAGSVELTPVPA
jgi:hypothetical protein